MERELERVLLLLEYLWSQWRIWINTNPRQRKKRFETFQSKLAARQVDVFNYQRPFDRRLFLQGNQQINFENYLLPLPPMHHTATFFPCLHLNLWPSSSGEWCCRLAVLLYETDNEGNIEHEFGFRIESPEGPCQSFPSIGTHDFYHAQLLKRLRGLPNAIQGPAWIPDHQPSFALMAHNTTEALLNLLIALGGKDSLQDFWRDHTRVSLFKGRISDTFRKMLLES